MRICKLTNETKKELLGNLLQRNPGNYAEYENTVNEIITNVRNSGDKALFDYTLKFDKFDVSKDTIKVTKEEIADAYNELSDDFIDVMKKRAENIRVFH